LDNGSVGFDTLSSPIIGPDHTVYVGSSRCLLAVTNGALRWAFPDPDSTSNPVNFQSTPVMDAAGIVYAGGGDGNFYAINGNGLLAGLFHTSAGIVSSAVIDSNHRIYFASTDGVVYSLRIDSGPSTTAPWPMFRQNAAHTGVQPSGPALAHACGAPFPYIGEVSTRHQGLDGSGDFLFSFIGTPNTTWTLYRSTNFTSWSADGTTISVNSGARPQTGACKVANVNPSNEYYFMSSGGCCSKAIGFAQITIQPGTNLIADPFYQIDSTIVNSGAPNTLLNLLNPTTGAYDGVQIDEWNGAGFDAYTNDGSYWYLDGIANGDAPLRPGQPAIIIATNAITIPFIGLVRDGVEVAGMDYVTNPITSATNYLASILPLAGRLSADLGFPASHGDKVQLWTNGNTLETFTYANTCDGTNWAWCPSEPVLGLGQGFVLITGNTNNAWVQSVPPCYGQ
jgi:hypothetical protein